MPIDKAWIKRWETRLSKNLRAKIWWINYLYDKKHANLPRAVVDKFEDELVRSESRAAAAEAGSTMPVSAVEVIAGAVGSDPPAFELQCTRAPATTEPYCCVIDSASFADFYVTPGQNIGLEMTESSLTEDEVWDRWGAELSAADLDGTLRSSRPFFWFTTRACINTIRPHTFPSGPNQLATDIRDGLGLSKYGLGQRLFLLLIPEGALSPAAIRAPTTLDAGAANPVFAPSDDANGCGWTLSLRRLGRGCEEFVSPAIPVTPDFNAEKIGHVAAPSPVDVAVPHQLRLLKRAAANRLSR